jgi:hypothetical protein
VTGPESGRPGDDDRLEGALAEVEDRADSPGDHEGRLEALEKLHDEVEEELDERDGRSRPDD